MAAAGDADAYQVIAALLTARPGAVGEVAYLPPSALPPEAAASGAAVVADGTITARAAAAATRRTDAVTAICAAAGGLPAPAHSSASLPPALPTSIIGIAYTLLAPAFRGATAAASRCSDDVAAPPSVWACVLPVLNPFHVTAWNAHRAWVTREVAASATAAHDNVEAAVSGVAAAVAAGRAWATLVQTRHPKAAEVWEYRRWLLHAESGALAALLPAGSTQLAAALLPGAVGEADAAASAVAAYARNYNAWSTRLACLRTVAAAGVPRVTAAYAVWELTRTLPAVRVTPRDYSAWSFRAAVLGAIVAAGEGIQAIAVRLAAGEALLVATVAAAHLPADTLQPTTVALVMAGCADAAHRADAHATHALHAALTAAMCALRPHRAAPSAPYRTAAAAAATADVTNLLAAVQAAATALLASGSSCSDPSLPLSLAAVVQEYLDAIPAAP